MERPDFFPGLAFGWAYYVVLVGILWVAAVVDFRTFRIPKPLVLVCLACGVGFNVVRGAWLGGMEKPVWKLASGTFLGGLDGFLFSAAGFATGLAIFVGLWVLGGCGGGDVKLYAAAGAWVGPWYMVYLMIVSAIVLIVVSIVWTLASMLGFGFAQTRRNFSHKEVTKNLRDGRRPKHRGMTYSFPLAITATVLLVMLLWKDLGFSTEARPATQTAASVR